MMRISVFLPCIYAFFACAGFCIMFEVHKMKFIVAGCSTGALSWFVFILLANFPSEVGKYFLATLVSATVAEIFARILKAPATIFLIVGIIPLVPGGGLYSTMDCLLNGEMVQFAEQGIRTAAYAGAIAVGCSLVSSVVRIINYSRNHKISFQ